MQGTAGSQAGALLDFLRTVSCDTLYLVGDIVDGAPGCAMRPGVQHAHATAQPTRSACRAAGWELSSSRVFWPQEHSDVVQKLLKKGRKGTKSASSRAVLPRCATAGG